MQKSNVERQVQRLSDKISSLELEIEQILSKKSIDLLDEVISNSGVGDAHLRMLVEKIIITEVDGTLDIEICLKAAFRRHYDIYDDFMVLVDSSVEIWPGDMLPVIETA